MYQDGIGVAKDDKEAVKWYQLAADQKNALAQTKLHLLKKEICINKIKSIIFKYKNDAPAIQSNKARLAADSLNTQLDQHFETLNESDSVDFPKALQTFKDNCARDVSAALPKLDKELGWGPYLLNFLTSLANVFISVITLGYRNGFFAKDHAAIRIEAENLEQEVMTLGM